MKKLIAAAGALCLLLSIAGCQEGGTGGLGTTGDSDVRGGAAGEPAAGGTFTDPAATGAGTTGMGTTGMGTTDMGTGAGVGSQPGVTGASGVGTAP